jgi:SAM-dependent methyltransferase
MVAPDPLSERARATWTAGDFGRIAKGYGRGGAEFIGRLGFSRNVPVLAVACGTGNGSLPAARIGAAVTGIDIAPNLVAQARIRAANNGLRVKFDVGNAEQLPYATASFRTVVSLFGAMFAPRPERAASEMLRVTRRGGRIAMGNWTPGGFIGQMLRLTAAHVPAPSDVPSPLLWGTEEAVAARLGTDVHSLTFARRVIAFEYPMSPEEVVSQFRLWYGPIVQAFARLNDANRQALRRELEQLWSDHNRARDGMTRVQSEYLEVFAIRR